MLSGAAWARPTGAAMPSGPNCGGSSAVTSTCCPVGTPSGNRTVTATWPVLMVMSHSAPAGRDEVTTPAMTRPSSVCWPPVTTLSAARTVKSRRSTSASTSSTSAPDICRERQRQRDDEQNQGERQGRWQAGLLQRRPDLQRKRSRMVSDDNHGAERSHGPCPRDSQSHRQAGGGQRNGYPAEHPPGRIAEQRGLLLQSGVDAAEGRLRAEDVIGRRFVHLGDDQGQERVGR